MKYATKQQNKKGKTALSAAALFVCMAFCALPFSARAQEPAATTTPSAESASSSQNAPEASPAASPEQASPSVPASDTSGTSSQTDGTDPSLLPGIITLPDLSAIGVVPTPDPAPAPAPAKTQTSAKKSPAASSKSASTKPVKTVHPATSTAETSTSEMPATDTPVLSTKMPNGGTQIFSSSLAAGLGSVHSLGQPSNYYVLKGLGDTTTRVLVWSAEFLALMGIALTARAQWLRYKTRPRIRALGRMREA